jgi:hypothetical protein
MTLIALLALLAVVGYIMVYPFMEFAWNAIIQLARILG